VHYFSFGKINILISSAQDVRPGLILKRSQQREHEILKKRLKTDLENRNAHRPARVVEAERREEGLQSAISSSNKGFALLQKMGYKPGTGIGKTGIVTSSMVPLMDKLIQDIHICCWGSHEEACIVSVVFANIVKQVHLFCVTCYLSDFH